jgi:hypothetical protein
MERIKDAKFVKLHDSIEDQVEEVGIKQLLSLLEKLMLYFLNEFYVIQYFSQI